MATTPADPSTPAKRGPNTYTVLLGLTLLFITIACICLVIELRNYGNFPFEITWRPPVQ